MSEYVLRVNKLTKNYNESKVLDDVCITILVSSHILLDLYQLATDYIIINKGRIVEQLTLAQLDDKCKKHILIETEDVDKAVTLLGEKLKIDNFKVISDDKIKLYCNIYDVKTLAKMLFDGGVLTTQCTTVGENLEQYFLELIGEKKDA